MMSFFFPEEKNFKLILKSNKEIPGFNKENNYTIEIDCKKGEKLYDVINKVNNFRSPENQIMLRKSKNVIIDKDMIIKIN